MYGWTGDLLGVNVVFQGLDAVNLGGLQGVLFFPSGLNPVNEGGGGLLVVLQLRVIWLQILESGWDKECLIKIKHNPLHLL